MLRAALLAVLLPTAALAEPEPNLALTAMPQAADPPVLHADASAAPIDDAAEAPVDPDALAIGTPSRGIHGMIGAEIGTSGTRALYGEATVPIGKDGWATVAGEVSRTGRR